MRIIYCISDVDCRYLSCLNDFDHNLALNTEGMLSGAGLGTLMPQTTAVINTTTVMA